MNLRSVLIGLTLVLLGIFALLNWTAFTAPTALTLGFAEVQAPLGLIMLVMTGVVSGLFLIYIVFQQAGLLIETRRYAKELKSHRELADKAEASRFTELRLFLEEELKKLAAQGRDETQQINTRLEGLERQILERLEESTGSLSACIGEVDDKLDRSSQILPRP